MGTVIRRKVFVDGDWIVYAAGFASQKTLYAYLDLEHGLTLKDVPNMTAIKEAVGDFRLPFDMQNVYSRTEVDPPEHVFQSAKMMLTKAIATVAERYPTYPLDVHVFIDGDGNFRHQIATIRPYKGTRIGPRPVMYADIREYLMENWGAKQVYGCETDDMLSMCVHAQGRGSAGPEPVVIGVDKDLLQIPCFHYNPNKGFCEITPELGEALVYRQCLQGDAVDNIGGCPGIGPIKAERLITLDMSTYDKWNEVLLQYALAHRKNPDCFRGLTPYEAALENMRLVWLRTDPGRMWTPPIPKEKR